MIAYKQKSISMLAIPFFLFSSAHANIISSIVKIPLSPFIIDLAKTKEESLIRSGKLKSSFQEVAQLINSLKKIIQSMDQSSGPSANGIMAISKNIASLLSNNTENSPAFVQFFLNTSTDKKTLALLFATNATVDTTATLVCDKKTKQSPISIFAENFACELSNHIICNTISPYMATQLCKQIIQEGNSPSVKIKTIGKTLHYIANNYLFCPLARKLVVKPIINNLFKAESE